MTTPPCCAVAFPSRWSNGLVHKSTGFSGAGIRAPSHRFIGADRLHGVQFHHSLHITAGLGADHAINSKMLCFLPFYYVVFCSIGLSRRGLAWCSAPRVRPGLGDPLCHALLIRQRDRRLPFGQERYLSDGPLSSRVSVPSKVSPTVITARCRAYPGPSVWT